MIRTGLPPTVAFFIFGIVVLALLIWPASRICRRLGFSPWLGVLIVVPLANLILL